MKYKDSVHECIYCLKDKPEDRFTKEHVLHQSFGHYKSALTLTKEVCHDCNQIFANNIDNKLSRDSFESFCRLKHGIKTSDKKYPYERIRITYPKEDKSDWAGVKFGYKTNSFYPLSQLGFIEEGTVDYKYFTLSELKKGLHLKDFSIDRKANVKIISKDEEEKNIYDLI